MAFLGHQYKYKKKETNLRANFLDYKNSHKYGNDLATTEGRDRAAV